MSKKTSIATTTCLLYPIATIPLIDEELLKEEQMLIEKENNITANINVVLPPTPTASDDEQEEKETIKQMPQVKLARRGTVSLADLIPVAHAALKAKRLSMQQEQLNNPPSTQDSPLARALTKVKVGVLTHRIKERNLTNEWIRLALAVPIDESTINSNFRIHKVNRTKEIVKWYEYKYKRLVLNLEELEKKVDELRQQRLLLVQQQQNNNVSTSPIVLLKI